MLCACIFYPFNQWHICIWCDFSEPHTCKQKMHLIKLHLSSNKLMLCAQDRSRPATNSKQPWFFSTCSMQGLDWCSNQTCSKPINQRKLPVDQIWSSYYQGSIRVQQQQQHYYWHPFLSTMVTSSRINYPPS